MTILNAQWRPNDGKVSQSVDSTKMLRFEILTVTDRVRRLEISSRNITQNLTRNVTRNLTRNVTRKFLL